MDLGATDTISQVVLTWEAAYGKSFQIQTSTNGSTWTSIYSTTTGTGGTQTLNVSGSGRYVRMYGTARATSYGYSLWEFQVYGTAAGGGTGGGVCPTQSDTPNFGSNVHIFDPSMSATTIQNQLNADFNAQKDTNTAQFATGRVAELFKPGTYSAEDNVGFYTSVAGLGLNPDDVTINGDVTVDAFNSSDAGNATQNFWRSAENLAVNPSGGSDRWAVAQAAPFRRMDIHGGLQLYPASYGYASGGYISDTKVTGQVSSVSQQQWYSKDSNFGSWSGGVWNMVFSGVTGAPAQSFPNPPETVLATTPVSRDVPYLYVTSDGKYHVFVPSLRTNSSGTSWPNTPGSSLPMSQFYVVKSGDTAATINSALANGCNLFFTPGVYHLSQTLNVTKANTVILGVGFPTLIPDGGVDAMHVADVDGVRLKGLLFDAGTTNSNSLLTVGTAGLRRLTRLEPDQHPGRVLPDRGCRGGQGDEQPDRQRERLADRPHLGLAGRSRQRRRLDLQHRRHRSDRERQQRAGHRLVRRALPEVRGGLERPERQDHLLPERESVRPAEPGGLDEPVRDQWLCRLQGGQLGHHPRGVGIGKLLLLQRQSRGEQLSRL